MGVFIGAITLSFYRNCYGKYGAYMSKSTLACLAAALFSFYNIFLLSLVNVISADLIKTFHISTASLGFLSSCDLWANAMGFIPIGILLDSYSVRRVGLSMLSIAIIATLIMSVTNSFAITCAMRFLQGLASATSLLITMRLGSKMFEKNVNIVVGMMITLALSGGIMGNSIFAQITHMIGWRYALQLASGIGLICLIMMWCNLIDIPLDRLQQIKTNILNNIVVTLKANNILAGVYLGLINAPVFVLGTLWGNYYLVHMQHLTLLQAANMSTLIFTGIIIGSLFWGIIADKWLDVKKINVFSCVCLFLLCLPLLSYRILPLEIIILIFFGFGFFSCSQNLIYPLISNQNPVLLVSTATGIAAVISNSIGAGMQELFGGLIGLHFGNYQVALFLLPLSFLCCGIIANRLNVRLFLPQPSLSH